MIASRTPRFPRFAVLLATVVLAASPLPVRAAAEPEVVPSAVAKVSAGYTKYEHRIPMRDGRRLFTAVYVPKDDSREYALMLLRTPYGIDPYGADNYPDELGPSEHFSREGFIFVYQDVRGRFLSEGTFEEMRPQLPASQLPASHGPQEIDESTDAYDTIEWLLKNVPGHNGKVGMWGISYPGFYAAAALADAHPALVAVSPQAPVTDLFLGDDSYHNGAFMLAANFGFFTFFEKHDQARLPEKSVEFDYGTPDGYRFFLDLGPLANARKYFRSENPYWAALMEHTTYDHFWQKRALQRHLRNVKPAVLTVGGFFDAEDPAGPLLVYHAVEKVSPGADNHLVLGPWSHGGWAWGQGDRLGDIDFRVATGEYFRQEIEFEFFRRHLADPPAKGGKAPAFPKAWIFETGTHRWRKFGAWPPREAVREKLYLRAEGRLSFEPPLPSDAGEAGSSGDASDHYVSDPAKPVPFWNGLATRVPREYMVADQRFAATRPDVLVYQTETLEEDLSVCGPVSPTLWISSTGTDADFVVKLIDVYPGNFPNPEPNPKELQMAGYQQLLRGEPFRAKFRNSLENPEPLVPGQLAKIHFSMPDICHVFRRGHRLMVQIQSTWFPLVDRNPQTFTDIPNAKSEDFRKAAQQIFRSRENASYLELPILGLARPKD